MPDALARRQQREADRHFLAGHRYLRRGDRSAAESAFQQAVRLHPRQAHFALHLALLQAEEGHPSQGLKTLRPLLTAQPRQPVLLAFRALLECDLQRWAAAEASLQAAAEVEPDNLLLPALGALVWWGQGQLEAGLRRLGQGPLCENPLILAHLLRELDRLQPAPPTLPSVAPLGLRPRTAHGWYRWGLRKLEDDRWLRRLLRGSLQEWDRLTFAWKQYQLGMEQAAQALEQALATDPELPEIRFYTTAAWFEARRPHQAWSALEPAFEPQTDQALSRQASLSSEAGDWRALYAAAIRLQLHDLEGVADLLAQAPPCADRDYWQARLQLASHHPLKALARYRRAVEQDPTLPRRRAVEAIAWLRLAQPG